MARKKTFTIYDLMEERGVFESNPANIGARGKDGENLYQGPIPFPKMLYHPKGEKVVTVAGEIISTPFGPKEVGKQSELISRIVSSQKELDEALRDGWHDHPAKAIAAGGGIAPATSSEQRISDLQAMIAKLQAEKADQEARVLAGVKPVVVQNKPRASPGE